MSIDYEAYVLARCHESGIPVSSQKELDALVLGVRAALSVAEALGLGSDIDWSLFQEANDPNLGWQCAACRWATVDLDVIRRTNRPDGMTCPQCGAVGEFIDYYRTA